MARRRRLGRFAGAALAVALIAALPALVGARSGPPDRPGLTARQVIAAVRASTGQAYSGYAESHGDAAIPDVSQLGSLPSLLGDTTRLRVWWSGSQQWRVDQVGSNSENDTYAYPGGTWEWASATRTATAVSGVSPIRLLRPADLTPDQLGRRLAALADAPSSHVERTGARRVAGRTALGVQITGGADTTVASLDIWADETTGVPLAVYVTARGQTRPTISSSFLSFDPSSPKASTTTFRPPADARTQEIDDRSLRGLLGRLRPLLAPEQVVGLPSSEVIPGQTGVATYGSGLAQLAIVSLSRGDAEGLAHDLARVAQVDGSTSTVSTPLVNLVLVRDGWRNLLAAGSVPLSTLRMAVSELIGAPPLFGQPT